MEVSTSQQPRAIVRERRATPRLRAPTATRATLLVQVIRSETAAEGGFSTAFQFAMFEADSRRRVSQLLEGVARTFGFTGGTH